MGGLVAKVQLISNALILLGDKPIASLTDNTVGATLGANLFENTYLSMLQNHRWRFSVKVATLSRLSAKPETGYQYAFAIPSDMLLLIQGSARDYSIYGKEVHSNSTDMKIEYTSRVEEDTIPAYFAKALEFNLAAQFAFPLTGNIDKGTYYTAKYKDEVRMAKFSDSTQYPEVSVQDEPYITARF